MHLTSYLAVGAFFLIMNLVTWDGEFWFFFPLIPWGLGLAFHYFSVFGTPFIGGPDWEERELEKERRRLASKYGPTLPEAPKQDERLELRELRKEQRKAYDDNELV